MKPGCACCPLCEGGDACSMTGACDHGPDAGACVPCHIENEMCRRTKVWELVPAALLALKEIEQFHAKAYPKCEGECPAHEAMAALKKALGLSQG